MLRLFVRRVAGRARCRRRGCARRPKPNRVATRRASSRPVATVYQAPPGVVSPLADRSGRPAGLVAVVDPTDLPEGEGEAIRSRNRPTCTSRLRILSPPPSGSNLDLLGEIAGTRRKVWAQATRRRGGDHRERAHRRAAGKRAAAASSPRFTMRLAPVRPVSDPAGLFHSERRTPGFHHSRSVSAADGGDGCSPRHTVAQRRTPSPPKCSAADRGGTCVRFIPVAAPGHCETAAQRIGPQASFARTWRFCSTRSPSSCPL